MSCDIDCANAIESRQMLYIMWDMWFKTSSFVWLMENKMEMEMEMEKVEPFRE